MKTALYYNIEKSKKCTEHNGWYWFLEKVHKVYIKMENIKIQG